MRKKKGNKNVHVYVEFAAPISILCCAPVFKVIKINRFFYFKKIKYVPLSYNFYFAKQKFSPCVYDIVYSLMLTILHSIPLVFLENADQINNRYKMCINNKVHYIN